MIDDELSRAVVTFLGAAGVLEPTEPEHRVVALLGDRALELVPRIRSMLDELHAVNPPPWNTADLRDMSRNVERWLRENHPELDERAVNALANTYTFDYKQLGGSDLSVLSAACPDTSIGFCCASESSGPAGVVGRSGKGGVVGEVVAVGEPTGLLACPSGMDPKLRCHPARRQVLAPVVGLALLLSLGACGTTPAGPGGGSTGPEDHVTSVVGDGPLDGTASTAAPIPQAPPPQAFRTRSDVVAAAVRATGIPQPPTGLVLESSRTPELGFDTAEQKQAWTAGRVTLGPGWSRDSPGAAQIRFADGTSQPVDALDAQAALDAALAPSPDACSGLDPAACTLTFTNGSMTTVKVTTNRGQATVPAWSFQAAGLSHPVVVVAVPSGILQDAPAPTPPSSLPDPGPGLDGVETWPGTPASTSGSNLTVAIGHGACDRELHAHVVEYADLVVAGATFAAPPPGSACTSQLIVTPATLTLSRPLGDRPVISVTTGVAIPIRR